MKADFSGYATKAGLKCTDGRTIMPDAFKHQDQMRVPLVWQHGHNDPENVLGHAILENRTDGVYAYAFFNGTSKAAHAKNLVEHGDITMLSIWANNLIERAGRVLHGAIREVSLVLSGANPGAVIENVTLRHGDGADQVLDDEAIIYTGLELEHQDQSQDEATDESDSLEHAEESTIEEVYNSMNDDQKKVLHFMVGEALAQAQEDATLAQSDVDSDTDQDDSEMNHSDEGSDDDTNNEIDNTEKEENMGTLAHIDENSSIEEVYNSMSEEQQTVLHFMIGQAVEDATKELAQSDMGSDYMRNIFETAEANRPVELSHSEIQGIVADATRNGSLKEAVERYALSHSIENIDLLFPEARTIDDTPEFHKRRTEWVTDLLAGTRKSPMNRIKTIMADLTYDDARAKGYVKGAMKKDEFFSVSRRITTPTTIYKKQKLDRDDMIDITDFNVVVWLKGEMRIMLEEEIARAVLLGDGREVGTEDKVNADCIRPIAFDHELYTTTVNVNIDDAQSSQQEVIDAIVANRHFYKGTGMPLFYTSELQIAKFMLLKDTTGRRIYKTLDELAAELRVSKVVPVEVMEEYPDIIGVIVNPIDYVIGSNAGGEVNMFDDFDIDYNQHKYLIETRICGALVKLKSAMVIKKVAASLVLVTPTKPGFVVNTGVITIPTVTGVVYKNGAGTTLTAGAQTALNDGASLVVNATPDTGYYFATTEDDSWTFKRDAGA